MITIEQLKDLQNREANLRRYLAIDEKQMQLEEEELHTQAPDFWDDPKAAEAQMRKVKQLKSWIEGYDGVRKAVEELQLAFDFFHDEIVTEEEVDQAFAHATREVEDLEMKNMLSHEEDQMPAVLKIVAGAGGTEAQDWADMLFRMYMRYCEKHGYKTEISNLQEGEEAGIKTVTFKVEGDMAYGYLKSENGVHRLVRVSPYNAQGKRMTSFSSVFVVPLIDDSIEIEVNPAGISWDTFRSSGAGGQNVNKVASAVRITHFPTGIVVQCQNERSQLQNKAMCFNMLRSKLLEKKIEQRQAEAQAMKGDVKKIEWGAQIRSYVFCPYTLVKDHRTGYEKGDVQAVMDGEIQGYIIDYLKKF